jgi:hypothetical protein
MCFRRPHPSNFFYLSRLSYILYIFKVTRSQARSHIKLCCSGIFLVPKMKWFLDIPNERRSVIYVSVGTVTFLDESDRASKVQVDV